MRKAKTRLIAVEDTLSPVVEALRGRGYSVVELGGEDARRAEAVVVSGQEDNLMGIRTIETRVPVINAEGRTVDEIVRDVEDRLGPLGV